VDREKAKKKAEQLMALARSSQFPEESRNAAMQAIEIIHKYELLSTAAKRVNGAPKAKDPWEGLDKPWVGYSRVYKPALDEGKWINNGYDTNCKECLCFLSEEVRVLWKRGSGVLCERCVWRRVEG
jgi:hypothetical protein